MEFSIEQIKITGIKYVERIPPLRRPKISKLPIHFKVYDKNIKSPLNPSKEEINQALQTTGSNVEEIE